MVPRIARPLAASALIAGWLLAMPMPAAAECTYIPELPKVSFAVPSGAREIFVGTVTDAGEIRNDFQVRIEEVLRGPAAVGAARRFTRLAPNWPWSKSSIGDAYPGCTYLYASPGERVVILLDATSPGMWLEGNGQRWYQPPTRFHTIGILEGSSREQYGSGGRQLFSLDRLRAMVAELPATDTTASRPSSSTVPIGAFVVLLAGSSAGCSPCVYASGPDEDRGTTVTAPAGRRHRPVTAGRPRPPSVERVIASARPQLDGRDHDAVVAAAREIVDAERARLDGGSEPTGVADLGERLVELLETLERGAGPTRVINATGVIVHTNLGRAPWPRAAIEAAAAAAAGTLFLELDRATGRRGRRYRAAEEHLIALTGAEDALLVTNNAAALALAVGLAGRGGVVVSRGELVEIGGGVRIPEIIRRAGAKLIEVGTTNRTRVADFEEPLASGRARMALRVHPSNFRQEGFIEAPDPAALAELTHRHGALLVDDLGSGALLDTADYGLAHEPTPRERLAVGADIVTFSGDKLVGGPQAGLLVGRSELVAKLREDPLARAMRPDKTMLAAVATTLGLYRAGVATREIPVWRQIAVSAADLRHRADAVARSIGERAAVRDTRATVGGGSLPGETLPSVALAVTGRSADGVLRRLRMGTPAVIGRIEDGCVLLDLRTVEPEQDVGLATAVAAALDTR